MTKIVLFGDFLTQSSFVRGGWGARLANAYQRKADVLNRGFDGYNSHMALQVLDKAFTKTDDGLSLTTVWFGANDMAPSGKRISRAPVPVHQYRSNLVEIGTRLLEHSAPAVVLITPLPLTPSETRNEAESGIHAQGQGAEDAVWQQGTEMAAEYGAACREAGQRLGVPTLDLWADVQGDAGGVQEHLDGQQSLTPRGSRRLFKLLQKLVASQYPHLRPEALPDDAPDPHLFAAPPTLSSGFQQDFSLGTGPWEGQKLR